MPEDLIPIKTALISVAVKTSEEFNRLVKSLFYHNKRLEVYATPGTAAHIEDFVKADKNLKDKIKFPVAGVVEGYYVYRGNLIYTLKSGLKIGVGSAVDKRLDAFIVEMPAIEEDDRGPNLTQARKLTLREVSKNVDKGGLGLILGSGLSDPDVVIVATPRLYESLEDALLKHNGKTSEAERIQFVAISSDVGKSYWTKLTNYHLRKLDEINNGDK